MQLRGNWVRTNQSIEQTHKWVKHPQAEGRV